MSFSENRVLGPIYTLVVKHQGARLPSIRVYHQQAVQVHKIVEDPVPLNSTPSIFCGLEDHTNHKWPMTIVWICFNPFVNGISHEERGLTHQVYWLSIRGMILQLSFKKPPSDGYKIKALPGIPAQHGGCPGEDCWPPAKATWRDV